MLVSIIIPSFNQGRFIGQTLDSVLGQSYRPLDVVVVDGASTDETVSVLKDYAARYPQELRWLSEPDKGPADAVNKGLALVRGEVVGIQSSDDIYYPGVLAKAAEVFARNPDCGFVYGACDGMDEAGRPLGAGSLPDFSWEAFFGIAMCLPQGSIFFRRSVQQQVGGWNAKYFGCDLDFWMRILFHTRAIRIPESLSAWRMYPDQRTQPQRFARIWRDYWQMIEDSDDVRRATPRVRRLARASRHILALTLHPTGNLWSIRWHALLGLAQHPTYWRYQKPSQLKRLIPGYPWLSRAWQRLRAIAPKSADTSTIP